MHACRGAAGKIKWDTTSSRWRGFLCRRGILFFIGRTPQRCSPRHQIVSPTPSPLASVSRGACGCSFRAGETLGLFTLNLPALFSVHLPSLCVIGVRDTGPPQLRVTSLHFFFSPLSLSLFVSPLPRSRNECLPFPCTLFSIHRPMSPHSHPCSYDPRLAFSPNGICSPYSQSSVLSPDVLPQIPSRFSEPLSLSPDMLPTPNPIPSLPSPCPPVVVLILRGSLCVLPFCWLCFPACVLALFFILLFWGRVVLFVCVRLFCFCFCVLVWFVSPAAAEQPLRQPG